MKIVLLNPNVKSTNFSVNFCEPSGSECTPCGGDCGPGYNDPCEPIYHEENCGPDNSCHPYYDDECQPWEDAKEDE